MAYNRDAELPYTITYTSMYTNVYTRAGVYLHIPTWALGGDLFNPHPSPKKKPLSNFATVRMAYKRVASRSQRIRVTTKQYRWRGECHPCPVPPAGHAN